MATTLAKGQTLLRGLVSLAMGMIAWLAMQPVAEGRSVLDGWLVLLGDDVA